MKYYKLCDEQLILCLCQNNTEAYEELFRRSFEYGKVVSRPLESSFSLPYYDQAEFAFAVSTAFFNAINGYIVGSVPFVYYYNSIFKNQYRLSLIKIAKLCKKTCSIDANLSKNEELSFIDILPDKRILDCQESTLKSVTIEKINDSCDLNFTNLNQKMVVAYRFAGCTYEEISKLTKMSIKKIRLILTNKKFLKDLEKLKN